MTDLPTHTTLRCASCGSTVHVGVDYCIDCRPDMADECPGCVALRGRCEALEAENADMRALLKRHARDRLRERRIREALDGDT